MHDVSPYYHRRYQELSLHPLYESIENTDQLRIFMQHHVFAVWDFMSLIKAMQGFIAPVTIPWVPPENSRYVRLINHLVLDEESDHSLVDQQQSVYCSHYESYCNAMSEIGADTSQIESFIDTTKTRGIDAALNDSDIPASAKAFVGFTFDVIRSHQPHLVAGVLAYGREMLIPRLFQHLLMMPDVTQDSTPMLHAYLVRHIELDELDHGPLTVNMVQALCGDDPVKVAQVKNIAEQAVDARLRFWDGIYDALH
jgi:hypothetical protein